MIGLPFGRGAVVWDGPHMAQGGDEAAVRAVVEDWSERLRAATRRAEAMLA
jgi:hypothetical protein